MSFRILRNRQGLTVGILSVLIALGTGHVMQSAYGAALLDPPREVRTPNVPFAPSETLVPVVLVTPPPLRMPGTLG